MKKIHFVLLALLLFSACSKDSGESDITPTDGQYVGYIKYEGEYSDYNKTICLVLENGLCTDLVIYSGTERFNYYHPADISTQGSYPKYTYRINDFMMQTRFADLENFTANLSGMLRTHKETPDVGETYSIIELEAKGVQFRLDNTPLDADGDGLLDSKQ